MSDEEIYVFLVFLSLLGLMLLLGDWLGSHSQF